MALEVKSMVKREFDSVQQAEAWYASERSEPLVEAVAAVPNGELCKANQYMCCNLPPTRLSVDSSISTDESSGDSDDTESEDDASDYGTVKSFVADMYDSGEDPYTSDQEFLTPPSTPRSLPFDRQDSWNWRQMDFDLDPPFQDEYGGAADMLERKSSDCTTSSSRTENTEYGWGDVLPLVTKGTFDMGQPPGMKCNGGGCYWAEGHALPETETYRDVLIVFRFKDPMLPFELQKIVMADSKLLKMLESGLPSWVIFLQSYPIFCQLYRPWMRPLCGTIYFMVSVVTVVIGFYDLYKNVPILKATAARLCGPLFEWIEHWEMISRLKYLGTMLVLQNFEKAFRWLFITVRAIRQLCLLLMRPFVEPLALLVDVVLPAWGMLLGFLLGCWNLVSMTLSSVFLTLDSLLRFMVWPFCVLLSSVWNLGKCSFSRINDFIV